MSSIVPSGDAIHQERTANHEAAAIEWREQARLMREAALMLYGALKMVAECGASLGSEGASAVCVRAESVLFPPEPEAAAGNQE